MKSLEERILDLEKQISELQKKQQSNLNIFGGVYEQLGNLNSDTVIRTKGKLKVQYGNKFIDLLKDGKLNVDYSCIYTGDKVGSSEGIWIVNNSEVWINPKKGDPIKITFEKNFVSYQEQKLTPEEQLQTLVNLGFIYNTKDDIDLTCDRVVYVIQDKQLYSVSDKQLSPIISQQESSNNSLVLNGATSESEIVSDTFKSKNGSTNKGFVLKMQGDKSILYVDKIVERNAIKAPDEEVSTLEIYPEFYLSTVNFIKETQEMMIVYIGPDIGPDTGNATEAAGLQITLKEPNKYDIGDVIGVYVNSELIELTIANKDEYDSKVIFAYPQVGIDPNSVCFLLKRKNYPVLKIDDSGVSLMQEDILLGKIGSIPEDITGTAYNGVYQKYAQFENASYISSYELEDEDNSTRFASTEWVNKQIQKLKQL